MRVNFQNNADITTGLAAWYRMNGSGEMDGVAGHVIDSSVNAFHATALGSTKPTIVAGKIGNCGSFNGTTAYVKSVGNFALPSALTVAAWIKPSAVSRVQVISAQYISGGANNFQLFVYSDNSVTARIFGATNSIWIGRSASNAIPLSGNWYHVMMTWSGGNTSAAVKIYVNNINVDNADSKGGTFTTPSTASIPIEIGSQSNGGTNFAGLIDDTRYYSRVLLEADRTALYNYAG